ncbi:very short patch repair endonuclease [Virgisporangium ochraceum]|uniref:Very short patch repair endonuclease n=1 Tax=Virgisporangium ochraceum TaxID=65505 RepID=A0A8J4EI57_9ACTN|nr:very short patch repair endonuclease [Virgisporangium ochraceum]
MSKRWQSTSQGQHLRGRRRTNTEPEMMLRRALHAAGARFRLHRRLAPGCTPDIVLPGRRIAVFVDGDYWHSCPVHGRRKPFVGPNADLWAAKLARNKARDQHSSRLATDAGWTVVRVWECAVRHDPAAAAEAVLAGRSVGPVPAQSATSPAPGPPGVGPTTL